MMDRAGLYDDDFAAWSKQQAKALRDAALKNSNLPLDWQNLAEEIEDLSKREERELSSQIKRIIHHLLKLENSRARNPRRGWENSIIDARDEIEDLLERSPSLRREIGDEITRQTSRASRLAIRDLGKRAEVDPALVDRIRATIYTEEQVISDWFPEKPPGAE